MRLVFSIVTAAVCCLGATDLDAQDADAPADALATASQPAEATDAVDMAKVSYVIGYDFGNQVRGSEVGIDPEALIEGVRAATSGQESKLSAQETQDTMMAFQQKLMQQAQAGGDAPASPDVAARAAESTAAGQAYQQKNAEQEGVVTTDSGLQYRIVEQGEGQSPDASDFVVVNYEGKLINGEVFDSSYQRAEPALFRVNQVIPGWTEALQPDEARRKVRAGRSVRAGLRRDGQPAGTHRAQRDAGVHRRVAHRAAKAGTVNFPTCSDTSASQRWGCGCCRWLARWWRHRRKHPHRPPRHRPSACHQRHCAA